MKKVKVNTNYIKVLRKNKNISIEKMSFLMGYKGYQAYYYKENGIRKMSAEDIAMISQILEIPMKELYVYFD
ncbi:helix-turn-helix transcriptional regulator [Kurthia gibsonii]|uniref:helix-turn-helix domain-containing protein n=1 Tax=Kurthia gibsonii TaxID=33946 RepID=UPI00301609A7